MSALSIKIGRGASRLPADIALLVIPSLPRPVLERLAQRIIDHLDNTDAATEDMEDDDPAGMMDEDELTTGPSVFAMHGLAFDGPGCPLSDPGEVDGRKQPSICYDGEDQGVIVFPAPGGIEPTRWSVS